MRGSLSRKGQKSLAQPFRGCYETVPSLRDSNRISHLTRHFAYGFVPGYDCFVPSALDFDNLVPPSSERIEFRNSLFKAGYASPMIPESRSLDYSWGLEEGREIAESGWKASSKDEETG